MAANKTQAFMSRELATIVRNMAIENELDDFKVKEINRAELISLYQRLQFNNFLNALLETAPVPDAAPEEIDAV